MNRNTLEKIIGSIPGWTKDTRSQKYTNAAENSVIYYIAITDSKTSPLDTRLIIQTKNLSQKEINDTDKRRFYLVCDEAKGKPIETALAKMNIPIDLIIAVERLNYKVAADKLTPLTIDSMVEKLKNYVVTNNNDIKDFYRIETIRDKPENSFYDIVNIP